MMQAPQLNINGTSAEDLINQYLAATVAVEAAVTAVGKIDVHGRDYQTLPDKAFRIAQAEHRLRLEYLHSVHEDLREIYHALCAQVR